MTSATLARAPRVLPAETDDPREALLDLFEGQVRTLLAHGLEAQMRARMARLLPGIEGGAATQPGPGNVPTVSPDDALLWAGVLTALGYASRARLTEAEHAHVAATRLAARRRIESLNREGA